MSLRNNSLFFWFPVSDENLKKSIKQMDTQLKQLETDLKSLKKSAGDGDRFQDVMNISFVLLHSVKDRTILE